MTTIAANADWFKRGYDAADRGEVPAFGQPDGYGTTGMTDPTPQDNGSDEPQPTWTDEAIAASNAAQAAEDDEMSTAELRRILAPVLAVPGISGVHVTQARCDWLTATDSDVPARGVTVGLVLGGKAYNGNGCDVGAALADLLRQLAKVAGRVVAL